MWIFKSSDNRGNVSEQEMTEKQALAQIANREREFDRGFVRKTDKRARTENGAIYTYKKRCKLDQGGWYITTVEIFEVK